MNNAKLYIRERRIKWKRKKRKKMLQKKCMKQDCKTCLSYILFAVKMHYEIYFVICQKGLHAFYLWF